MSDTAQSAGAVLFLRAQTSLHPGAGDSVGSVDLPVQRERHTGWPLIQGTALKGVLRDQYRLDLMRKRPGMNHKAADEHASTSAIFGPSNNPEAPDDEHRVGALMITDARILAFPVRSAVGVFAWVTCEGVLERLRRDLAMIAVREDAMPPLFGVGASEAAVSSQMQIGDSVIFEDLLLRPDAQTQRQLAELGRWVKNHAFAGPALSALADPCQRLSVIGDDAFTHLVKHATEIATRIRLNPESKTVERGALFSQELLPPETMMYAVLLAQRAKAKEVDLPARSVLAEIRAICDGKPIQIGGDETTGKGWCWAKAQAAEEFTGAK